MTVKDIQKAAEQDSLISSGPVSRSSKKYEFIKYPSQTILPQSGISENNSFIVMGNVGAGPTGFGNSGVKSTGNIVLGVGIRATPKGIPPPQNLEFSPNFYHDSAVIYISEQCDVDEDFKFGGLKKTYDRSAIALKADELRMFSRGEIKLVTGMDQTTSPIPKDPDDKDAKKYDHKPIDSCGISIIANNNTKTLQHMVKGDNLVLLLTEALEELSQAYSQLSSFISNQLDINRALIEHTHLSDFTTGPLARSTDPYMISIIESKNDKILKTFETITSRRVPNIQSLKNNYLSKNSAKYINSRYNKVN